MYNNTYGIDPLAEEIDELAESNSMSNASFSANFGEVENPDDLVDESNTSLVIIIVIVVLLVIVAGVLTKLKQNK